MPLKLSVTLWLLHLGFYLHHSGCYARLSPYLVGSHVLPCLTCFSAFCLSMLLHTPQEWFSLPNPPHVLQYAGHCLSWWIYPECLHLLTWWFGMISFCCCAFLQHLLSCFVHSHITFCLLYLCFPTSLSGTLGFALFRPNKDFFTFYLAVSFIVVSSLLIPAVMASSFALFMKCSFRLLSFSSYLLCMAFILNLSTYSYSVSSDSLLNL